MQLDLVHPWFKIGGIALALMLPACGAESPPSAIGATAVPVSHDPGNRPAQITSVRFEPAEPMADEAVRAVVKASDPDGDPVKLIYEWEVAGRAVGRGTQRLVLDGASAGNRGMFRRRPGVRGVDRLRTVNLRWSVDLHASLLSTSENPCGRGERRSPRAVVLCRLLENAGPC